MDLWKRSESGERFRDLEGWIDGKVDLLVIFIAGGVIHQPFEWLELRF